MPAPRAGLAAVSLRSCSLGGDGVTLKPSEVDLLSKLYTNLSASAADDELLLRYYEGRQRFQHIGLALPPAYRHGYDVVTSGPAVVVDSVVDRQQVRAFVLPSEEQADDTLQAIAQGSNLDAQLQMFNRDRRIYGRAFLSVGTNERDTERPLVRVESPREMAGLIDQRHEVATAAARFYGTDPETGHSPIFATLYLPDVTVWVGWSSQTGRWLEVDRDDHRLGETPIFMHLNRRASGSWTGRPALTQSILSIVDGACRNLTNMQFASEAHGVPRMWMTGVARGDFVDANGNPIPQWEAYFNAIHTLTKEGAKIGQLTASDLKNFETAQAMYAREMSQATGFPADYFGMTSVNPPAEGAIRGAESRLIRRTESENVEVGMTLGWAMATAYQFATGTKVDGNRVRVDWHDPATPTVAQRMDAVVKAKQSGIVSREGAWDELGWSEARKARERAYFAQEATDSPEVAAALALMNGTAGGGA